MIPSRFIALFQHLAYPYEHKNGGRAAEKPAHSRCEVGRCCGGFGGVPVQSGSPDSTFVTKKRADPVPCVSLAQHGLAICEEQAESHLHYRHSHILERVPVRSG